MASKIRCFLRPVDAAHEPIELQDNTPIEIGRGPITMIKDSRCSRNQVVFVANFATYSIKTTQLGRNACAIDGVELKKECCVEMKHGQKFDVLLGQYSYIVEFDPAPGKRAAVQKRTINDVSDSEEEQEASSAPSKQPKIAPSVKSADLQVTQDLWETVASDLIIYGSRRFPNSDKIAAYDLDGTIIVTASGATFPKNPNDWKIQYPSVLDKLTKLTKDGYKIVIFTNQLSLNNHPNTAALVRAYQTKIEAIVRKLNTPVEVYVAKGKGMVRKPCTGMWNAMMGRNGNLVIDKSASFFCGDAAGRVLSNGKADHSQADLLFAKNVGLKFLTPDEHFLGKKEKCTVKITAFDYNSLAMNVPLCQPEYKSITAPRQEMVVMVGCPGSGKSHFVATHMVPSGYKVVSRDQLHTMEKCLAKMDELLSQGHSVVLDNTNPNVTARRKFLELAKSKGIACRIFVMNITIQHAKHNNKFRQLIDQNHDVIGDQIINMFFQKYEEPSLKECSEVVKINFWPVFKCPDQETLYKQFLCEK